MPEVTIGVKVASEMDALGGILQFIFYAENEVLSLPNFEISENMYTSKLNHGQY